MMSDGLHGVEMRKVVGGKALLDGVDLRVCRGRCTVLLGTNGAGKTLALKALSLVDPPTTGRITLDGRSFDFGSGRTRIYPKPWPTVGMLFAYPHLWPHLTLRQNISLVARASSNVSAAQAEAKRLGAELEIESLLDRWPHQISRGEQQRAALVRALTARPTYLLADEPTSNLSIEHTTTVARIFRELCADGRGVLVVTHLLGLARQLANDVVYMSAGKVAEHGDAAILKQPQSTALQQFLRLMDGA